MARACAARTCGDARVLRAAQTLEVRAVELGVPSPPEVLAELTARVAGMSLAFARNNLPVFAEQALLMHRQIVQAGGNRIFGNVWDSMHWEVRGRVALQRIAERGEGLRALLRAARIAAREAPPGGRAGRDCRAENDLRAHREAVRRRLTAVGHDG